MDKMIIENIKKIEINKLGIIINQNDGGTIKLSKEQLINIGNSYSK